MRHLLFPSKEQADAFIEDLRAQGVIQPEIGHTTLNRRASAAMGDTGTSTGATTTTTTTTEGTGYIEGGGTAEDVGEGAIRGTGVGAAVGTIAGAVATVATGGLGLVAVPVILGMTALGSGVGAGVGAIGGAAGVDETGGAATSSTSRYAESYDIDHDQHDRLSSGMNAGGRAVAVEDNIPSNVVEAAAARHGGQFV